MIKTLGICDAKNKSGWQSIRILTVSPQGNRILTSLRFAGGEADVQPSLLPAYLTTGFKESQGLFELKIVRWATLHKEVMPEKGVYFSSIASKMLAIHQGSLCFFLI